MRTLKISAAAAGLLLLLSAVPWRALAENISSFDGTIYAALKIASLANFPATVGGAPTSFSSGAQIVEQGARVACVSAPAGGTLAGCTLGALATGRRVADCVTFSATSNGAVTAATTQIVLRDGATGAGTIVLVWNVALPVAAAAGVQEIPPISFCGLHIVGTTNTAMTLEFAAGTANVTEAVGLTAFDVQ